MHVGDVHVVYLLLMCLHKIFFAQIILIPPPPLPCIFLCGKQENARDRKEWTKIYMLIFSHFGP